MKLLRAAAIEEVLAATPPDPATQAVVQAAAPFYLWSLSVGAIGDIRMQLPDEAKSVVGVELGDMAQGTIRDLFPFWTCWIHSGLWRAEVDLATHKYFLAAIQEYAAFSSCPIILGPLKQIHDGKHRLLAAYEQGLVQTSALRRTATTWRRSDLRLEVFWNVDSEPVGRT